MERKSHIRLLYLPAEEVRDNLTPILSGFGIEYDQVVLTVDEVPRAALVPFADHWQGLGQKTEEIREAYGWDELREIQ